MTPDLDKTFRCPTCGAAQELSDACRRCKCDLRLVRQTREAYRAHRARCLAALGRRQAAEAMHCASDSVRLAPGPGSYKLLAVCQLSFGSWPGALAAARQAIVLESR